MPQSFTPWYDDRPQATGTSPYIGPAPFFRDNMDARRTMWRRTPEAQYPDGYLGTLNTRRDDRLLKSMRSGQRNYQRGVHKGERINPSDYFWPDEFNLLSAIEQQAMGQRFSPLIYMDEPYHLTNGGIQGPSDPRRATEANTVPIQPDPDRAATLKRLAPSWGY